MNLRGKYDNSPTPPEVYDIVTRLGFTDVCKDINDNALLKDWPDKAYCNPPFSAKALFVRKAIKENREGKRVLLYLPLDPTTSWFRQLHDNHAIVLILMKKWRNRFPTALYLLSRSGDSYAFFVKDMHDLEVTLRVLL